MAKDKDNKISMPQTEYGPKLLGTQEELEKGEGYGQQCKT